MITVFTTCRPFWEEFAIHQRNAIRSWQKAVPGADIILLGDDEGTETAAKELGARHYSGFKTGLGRPYVADLWRVACEHAQYETKMFINADIILMSDFWPAAQVVMKRFADFLVIGRRTDITWNEPLSEPWEERLRQYVARTGQLYSSFGTDYFLFHGDFYHDTIPPKMLIACTLWDNWLVWRALDAGVPVVTATEAITAVHQLHPRDNSGWHAKMRRYNQQALGSWQKFLRGNQDATWCLHKNLRLERI